jgi:hypothetical protein
MKQRIAFVLITLAALTAFSDCTKDGLQQVEDVCSQMNDITFMDYCYRNFDVNNDGMVSMTEANAVKRIDVGGEDIYSLKGIEYFTQLKYLYCPDNYLTALDLSKNTQLIELVCGDNKISSLDLSALSKLNRDSSSPSDWAPQDDNVLITITDKKEYWSSLPSENDSKDWRIQWIWK